MITVMLIVLILIIFAGLISYFLNKNNQDKTNFYRIAMASLVASILFHVVYNKYYIDQINNKMDQIRERLDMIILYNE